MYTYQRESEMKSRPEEHESDLSATVAARRDNEDPARFGNLRSSTHSQKIQEVNPAEIYPNIHFEEINKDESPRAARSPSYGSDATPVISTASAERRAAGAGGKWWDNKPFGSPSPGQQPYLDDGRTNHAELEPEQDTSEPQVRHEPAQQWWQDKPFGSESPSATALPEASYKNNGVEVRLSGFTPLLGLTYAGQPPPPPPVINEATPDIWYHEYQAKKELEAVSQEEERIRGLRQKKEESKGGIGYKVGKFFSNTGAAVGKGVTGVAESHEAKVRNDNIKQAKARLAKYWPNQNVENFIVEFDAFGLHKNIPTRGHIILTQSSFLFLGKGKNELIIVDEIPLADIVSYTKGVALQCVDKEAKWVITQPNSFVHADALQIFTKNGIKLDFINFSQSILKGSSAMPGSYISDGHEDVLAYDRFFNYFDHAWRPTQQLRQ